jgi:arsenite/tail-anchored protein-transporting ATPase
MCRAEAAFPFRPQLLTAFALYDESVRILLFSGKGGVGKTTLAAATGMRLAEVGHRTLVMSVDPAHSLADSFDTETELFHRRTAEPLSISSHLDIQEVNIQHEIRRHWREISGYLSAVLRTTGVSDVEAEELAILPGMEELSAMMYVNQYRREDRYDVIVLDCAPTAESLRFVSMPTTLAWYMKHIFPFQRTMLKAVRPIAKHVAPVELPPDNYFTNIADLFAKLEGVDAVLGDPLVTSVRLVSNAEKMVLRETQRTFVYFSLHGLTVDTILVNRVLPEAVSDKFFAEWRKSQSAVLVEIDRYFAPVPVRRVPLFTHEVLGRDRLCDVASALYSQGEDPAAVLRTERPYTFEKVEGRWEVRLDVPFTSKAEVQLFKKRDELIVEVGTIRRHIGLPTSMSALEPSRARMMNGKLAIEMKEK